MRRQSTHCQSTGLVLTPAIQTPINSFQMLKKLLCLSSGQIQQLTREKTQNQNSLLDVKQGQLG